MILWVHRLATLAVAGVIAGCAAWNPPRDPASIDSISGRMSVRVEPAGDDKPRVVSAIFDLRGDAERGTLDLSTPLGTVLARANWSPTAVVLVSPDGEQRFADLDALTQRVLGESIPVAALFDWLRGRPWPGAPSTATSPPAAAGFDQLGWHVDLAQFADAWIIARRDRAPVVTVRAKLDR